METSIIVIGDEILQGQVTDTNSGFISRTVNAHGWQVRQITVVPDSAPAIRQAIEQALAQTPIVLTTGGLGPTKDDITRSVLMEIFGGTLRHDPEVAENIRRVFSARGLTVNPLTATQAMVPTSAQVIQNPLGTAPVMWFNRDGRVLVAMPGVPFETRHAFTHAVLPRLLSTFSTGITCAHRHFVATGVSESAMAGMLEEFERQLPANLHLAYLPYPGYLRLRLDGTHTDTAVVDRQLNTAAAALLEAAGKFIVSQADLQPAEILLQAARRAGVTIATAESCTGGNIAHRITAIAGCSDTFMGSVVAYSNAVKTRLLGVDPAAIEIHGAVSIAVVEQMATGAISATGATLAIATSGIAGPGGGTQAKPVGTVCVAVSLKRPDGTLLTHSDTLHLPSDRARVIDAATTRAILMAARLLNS